MRSAIHRLICIVAILALSAGCDSTREQVDRERQAADLIVGSSAARWSLFTLPRSGGTADLRPLVSPDSVVWNGQIELPAPEGVWRLGETAVVVLAEDGRLIRYDPVTDDTTQLATLSDEARMAGAAASAVVFLDSAARFAYAVGPEWSAGYPLPDSAAWAAPIETGIAVLTAGKPGRLLLIPRADSTAVVEVSSAGVPPALVTAWGRRVALTGPSGHTVRIYSTESLATGGEGEEGQEGDGTRLVGEAETDGRIRTLAASPSSHLIYAALDDPPRIVAISRFSHETRLVAETAGPVDGIRPALFGGALLLRMPEGLARMRTGTGDPEPLAGQWRSDLPLGLPGDLSIVLTDDEARLVSGADSAGSPLAGGAPRWWIPLRWNPGPDRAPDLAEALDELDETLPEAGEDAAGSATDSAAAEDVDIPQIGQEAAAAQSGPPGYYAIVASTRARAGVEALLDTLASAGYRTRVQTYPDQAGEVWHRGLVGPFPSRARAEAAARQLLRERGLQAWVTEIGASE